MSLHRLSAGAGYRYLIKHTACGDVARDARSSLTAYYASSGYPPGRWVGAGLAGFGNDGHRLAGSVVTAEQMAALFGAGRDPLTGAPLGRAYPSFAPAEQRIASRIAALPPDLDAAARAAAVAEIQRAERDRTSPVAVAGFDLTFTVPKSVSVLWALAQPSEQQAVAEAHHAAVDDVLAFAERRALFTRIGSQGCAKSPPMASWPPALITGTPAPVSRSTQ
jgi:TrwC relaxase